MTLNEAEKWLDHKSPLDVRITRFMFRAFCWHKYNEHAATADGLIFPIIISECKQCGHMKHRSNDGR